MKAYFQQLFEYNHWANNTFLDILEENPPSNDKILTLMAHIIAAENVWMHRIKGMAYEGIPLWEWHPQEEIKDLQNQVDNNWLSYVKELQEDEMEQIIHYKDIKGNPFTTSLKHILAHLINHGTHHRAQIASLMKEEGIAPPASDFIYYIRKAR